RLGLRDSVVNAALASRRGTPASSLRPQPPITLDRQEQAERTFLAMCLALPDEGERQLAEIELDDWFSAPATRRAGAYLRGRRRHGWVPFVRTGAEGHYRCGRCNSEAVAARRRRAKEILVAEAGGACAACGFAAYLGALQFHHRDPALKSFELSRQGVTR